MSLSTRNTDRNKLVAGEDRIEIQDHYGKNNKLQNLCKYHFKRESPVQRDLSVYDYGVQNMNLSKTLIIINRNAVISWSVDCQDVAHMRGTTDHEGTYSMITLYKNLMIFYEQETKIRVTNILKEHNCIFCDKQISRTNRLIDLHMNLFKTPHGNCLPICQIYNTRELISMIERRNPILGTYYDKLTRKSNRSIKQIIKNLDDLNKIKELIELIIINLRYDVYLIDTLKIFLFIQLQMNLEYDHIINHKRNIHTTQIRVRYLNLLLIEE
jgi:hypothetical protein